MSATLWSDMISKAIIPIRLVFFIWLVYYLEYNYQIRFSDFGIIPRTIVGLIGVFMSPLLHGSYHHILSNTIPILLLGGLIFNFYEAIAKKVFYWCYLLTGVLVWLLARPAIHIGASGLVYGLAFFLMFIGLFRRDLKSIIISIGVVLTYSGLFYGLFPSMSQMSWETHLIGAVVGIFCAFYFSRERKNSIGSRQNAVGK